jgi:hypothetical protein
MMRDKMQNFERWAKVYDLIYGKYEDDINFYKKEAKRAAKFLKLLVEREEFI